ncbi:protein kinase [Caenimonas sedimenti]|uniref:non-specific serine/threonine protein kinase n=1 Tax=Caenimonas sedimenti TaxID=2596921 RepID=A0A562ZQP2_9BURK|nr:protein kinase [Caenimonas sedimenti]TWO70628.1 protein kinase [Caenimonas sedimenti]
MPVESTMEADAQFPETEAVPLDTVLGAPPAAPQPVQGTIATFFYARLHNFAAACQGMSGQELTTFVNDVRRILSTAVAKLGGAIAQRRPDSILCAFTNPPDTPVPDHAKRALHAAILTVHEMAQLARQVAARPGGGTSPLSMAIGVHLGAGDITPRTNSQGMVHAVGEAVEIARLLEVTAADLHWGVVTSAATRQAAGTRVDSGRSGSLGLPDDTFLEVVEITGLVPRSGSTTPPSHYQSLRASLEQNQQLARAAAHAAQSGGTGALQTSSNLLIEGYRLLRKLGEGGIASVFLAQPMAGGAPQVLKVLRLDNEEGVLGLQRFMQEFALLAQIDHPNVARIFKQDFSAGNAYIAMEFFPLGDLRYRMRRVLDPAIAVYYIKQIAAGLEAIHQVGIVHRDLKPDNVMIRQDGMIAIADFGIAKQVSMQITDTGAGEIVGTPYYLSPEQALGEVVDARCDIYSLGIVAYEMLTGQKPYHAASAQDLLRMHVREPIPQLPAQHKHLQPVLDKMLAKDPAARYESAGALLDALEGL